MRITAELPYDIQNFHAAEFPEDCSATCSNKMIIVS